MELMNQPFSGQLGNRLIELLDSGDFHTLNIAVAFAKNSGVLRIKNALEKFRKSGGKVNVYVGVDLGGTSYEALTALLLYSDTLNVVHSEKGQTFHAKVYQFLGYAKGLLVVGSHNLTGGGLWTNFESSTFIPLEGSNASVAHIQAGMDDFLTKLKLLGDSIMSIEAQEDVEKLLQNGYVIKEVIEQVRQSKAAKKDGTQKRLFGYGVKAKLPHLPKSTGQGVATVSPTLPALAMVPDEAVGKTIWFETSRMTGGSRNILDLSMKSLVMSGDPSGTKFDLGDPKFMRGGVEFFGLNPANTKHTKHITLNFEGIDYFGNMILYPTGNKANGTWRLQIKGSNSSNTKITDAFRAKGEEFYLVKKIVTFTEIEAGYYFMSVFPEADLPSFEAASQILARNGVTGNSRKLGII
ncbi:phospholipase D family protein [Ferrovibrio sp.]|uniref:phospholipase D family protein n=1 Tax=Ferrovibrio sp. TaxID=1917215 RepID=UPI001B429947|nr:phospholipase D family protein [Ferrovibrio sp.]MBP7065424.1 phospholipase D family protein [Ferrovibrio sp.]